MSPEELVNKMKGMFPEFNRKRRRTSNCVDSGPPPKFPRNVHDYRVNVRDEPQRVRPIKKTFMGSMGAILSKLTSHSNACEPTKYEEYSDDENVIVLQRFNKNDLAAATRYSQMANNYQQSDKMDAVNHKSSATRPPPALIPKSRFSTVPNLKSMISARSPRMNGHQCGNETSGTRTTLVNGNSLSFKPHNSRPNDNSSHIGRNFSNYMGSASSFGPKYPTVANSINKTQADEEDRLRYAKMLKSCLPDYYQNIADHAPSSTSKRSSIVHNHVLNAKQPLLRKSITNILDDEYLKSHEDTRRLLGEYSINSERQVTPVNSVLLKNESRPVCQKSYPDDILEKYSSGRRERQEKISQQEKTSNQLSTIRLKHYNSFESLIPAWRTPDVVIFEEDVEDKVDDFPEFTDSQKQTIRQAMTGNIQSVLISKYNYTITRGHIHTLQWEPLAWLNDEVINFYMSLLTERGELRSSDGYPKVYAMSTFFLQRLCAGGYSAVKRWTKKVDIFACDIIPVPVHVSNVHWCMAIINLKEKTIKYYDSMGSPNNRVLSALEDYLREESRDKRKMEFDLSGWSKENVTDNPHQKNGSDCGVFSCMTAEFICRNRPIVFNQQHMNYFRQKMVLEICTGKMLL